MFHNVTFRKRRADALAHQEAELGQERDGDGLVRYICFFVSLGESSAQVQVVVAPEAKAFPKRL